MKMQDPIGFVIASGAVCASQLRATNFTTSRGHVDGRFATPSSITKHQVKRSTRVRTTSPQVDVPAPANEQTTNNSVRATGSPVEVTESTFEEEVLRSDIPVVVDFYASWCGPCKLMTPLMDWAAAEFEGKVKMVKIDTEENESFVKTYEIYGLPTFAVFVSGEARGLHEGAMSKVVFKDYIEEHAGLRA